MTRGVKFMLMLKNVVEYKMIVSIMMNKEIGDTARTHQIILCYPFVFDKYIMVS